jgi:HlyD family secretion protein
MKAKRAWLIGLVVVLAVGIGVFVSARAGRKPVTQYETVTVDRGSIVARVTATGTLSALVTVQVGSQVSGRIAQLFADYNSSVKKNDVIAKIDPELFKAAVEQARANYMAAMGNLEKSKAQSVDAARQYERAKALAEKQLIAIADRDTAESTALAAKAQVSASEGDVAQARASLHTAEVNLEYSTIKSPIDGVVISRSVDVGQTVAASLQAPTLFTIAEDLKKMQVDTNVAEADVGKLQPDMDATFSVDAYPQERFRGKVRQIRNAPITVQNVVTYDAVIDVDNPELKLKPGMTANVSFTYARRDDVLRVPNAALRFRPPGEMQRAASAVAASSASPEASASAGPEGHEGRVAAAGSSSPASSVASRTAHQGSPDRPRGQWRGPRGAHEPTNDRTLWVLEGPDPHPVTVRVGISDGTLTEVADGNLKAGDALVTDIADPTGARPTATGGGNLPGGMRRLF